MPIPLVLLQVLGYINWKKCIAGIVTFVAVLTLCILFLQQNAFTTTSTTVLSSLGLALIFAMGVAFSTYFRSAILTAVVLCFGRMGLIIFYAFGSWITTTIVLRGLVNNLQVNKGFLECAVSNQNRTENFDFNWHVSVLESLSSAIHYGFGLPFLLLIFHALVHICTTRLAVQQRMQRFVPDERQHPNLYVLLRSVFDTVGRVFVGIVFGVTLTVFYFHHLLAVSLVVDMSDAKTKCTLDSEGSSTTIIVSYLVYTSFLIVVMPFSKTISQCKDRAAECCEGQQNDTTNSNDTARAESCNSRVGSSVEQPRTLRNASAPACKITIPPGLFD